MKSKSIFLHPTSQLTFWPSAKSLTNRLKRKWREAKVFSFLLQILLHNLLVGDPPKKRSGSSKKKTTKNDDAVDDFDEGVRVDDSDSLKYADDQLTTFSNVEMRIADDGRGFLRQFRLDCWRLFFVRRCRRRRRCRCLVCRCRCCRGVSQHGHLAALL